MTFQKFDIAVIIGRFQPFHNGHAALIRRALTLADRAIVVVGSASPHRTERNPWSFEERARMIYGSFPHVIVIPQEDVPGDDAEWARQVREHVRAVTDDESIILVGNSKDDTEHYLQMFPWWGLQLQVVKCAFTATDIRRIYTSPLVDNATCEGLLSPVVPAATLDFLMERRE